MSEPLLTMIEQVSFTVKDLDTAVRRLTDVYGLGPWKLCNFGYLDGDDAFNRKTIKVENTIVEGRYVGAYAVRIAQCIAGPVEIELIEPMDEKSIFSQYLKAHGCGGQHLAVRNAGSFSQTMGVMAAQGYPLAQLAKIDDIEDCAFIDHMRTLGTYLELHQRPADFQLPEVLSEQTWPPSGRMEGQGLVSGVEAVSFVVENLHEARQLMENAYGVGPWETQTDGLPELIKSSCRSLNVRLELVQPLSQTCPAGRFLKTRGPGIFEVIFGGSVKKSVSYDCLGWLGTYLAIHI